MPRENIRIITAVVLSLSVHLLLMKADLRRPSGGRPPEKAPFRLTMTLTSAPVKAPPAEVSRETPPVAVPRKIDKPVVKFRPATVLKKSAASKAVEDPAPASMPALVPRLPVKTVSPEPQVPRPQTEKETIPGLAETLSPDGVQKDAFLALTAVREPVYRKNPPPRYPAAARRRRYQGTTLLEVLVDVHGRVGELRLAESSGHAMLDEAAGSAVRGWLFEPGRAGDQPVAMWVRVPVRFELQ